MARARPSTAVAPGASEAGGSPGPVVPVHQALPQALALWGSKHGREHVSVRKRVESGVPVTAWRGLAVAPRGGCEGVRRLPALRRAPPVRCEARSLAGDAPAEGLPNGDAPHSGVAAVAEITPPPSLNSPRRAFHIQLRPTLAAGGGLALVSSPPPVMFPLAPEAAVDSAVGAAHAGADLRGALQELLSQW